jgi:hypothetical protein
VEVKTGQEADPRLVSRASNVRWVTEPDGKKGKPQGEPWSTARTSQPTFCNHSKRATHPGLAARMPPRARVCVPAGAIHSAPHGGCRRLLAWARASLRRHVTGLRPTAGGDVVPPEAPRAVGVRQAGS